MECRQIDTGKMASEKDQRVYDMLLSSMGPLIRDLLQDDDVIEIMLNPDGHLWVDRLSSGRSYTGQNVSAQDAERIIRIVSSQISTVPAAPHCSKAHLYHSQKSHHDF